MRNPISGTFLAVTLAVSSVSAADQLTVWKAADLQAYEKSLARSINAQKLGNQRLADFGNHTAMIAHREATGEAEIHEKWTDVFYVVSGEAELVTGGKLAAAQQREPGEWRAPSIDGGSRAPLGAGDVARIPANMPHHLLVAKGKQVTYFVLKVEAK